MISQSQPNRFRNNWKADDSATMRNNISQTYRKTFYHNNNQCKKFFYHDVGPKRGKAAQRKFNRFNNNHIKNNQNKKNRNFYNLLQKTSGFSLEEQMIFERLWKGAMGQTFGNKLLAKQDKKNCCCHCQCGNLGGLSNRNDESKIGMLRSWMGNGIKKKTMKSVLR